VIKHSNSPWTDQEAVNLMRIIRLIYLFLKMREFLPCSYYFSKGVVPLISGSSMTEFLSLGVFETECL